MKKIERTIGERKYNYCLEKNTKVEFDKKVVEHLNANMKYGSFLNKVGKIVTINPDYHYPDKGWSFSQDVEFDNETIKNIPALFLKEIVNE